MCGETMLLTDTITDLIILFLKVQSNDELSKSSDKLFEVLMALYHSKYWWLCIIRSTDGSVSFEVLMAL